MQQQERHPDRQLLSLAPRCPDQSAAEEALSGFAYAQLIALRKYVIPHAVCETAGAKRVVQKHHIFPKALFPEFDRKQWNLVPLKISEHFDAHLLLSQAVPDEIALYRALTFMMKRYAVPPGMNQRDWGQLEEAERRANEAARVLQAQLRKRDWKCPNYRQKMSIIRSDRNRKNWEDPEYRRNQATKIRDGRTTKFFADPQAVARATAAQSAKTRGKQHANFKPVNIYLDSTGELVAENSCAAEFCRDHGLNPGHLYSTINSNRNEPSGRFNRAHTGGFFARAIAPDGSVIGIVAPAVPKVDHPNVKRADIFRASDDVCVAKNVNITHFCKANPLGVTFTQSALSGTARAALKGKKHVHKGFYARYCKP